MSSVLVSSQFLVKALELSAQHSVVEPRSSLLRFTVAEARIIC